MIRNPLADVVLSHLNGAKSDIFDSQEDQISAALLGLMWGASIEYDAEQREGLGGDHRATYRFHLDPFGMWQVCKRVGETTPEKITQVGSKSLILLLHDNIFADVLKPIKNNQYINSRLFSPLISKNELKKRLRISPKQNEFFERALRRDAIWPNERYREVEFDDNRVQDIVPFSPSGIFNEHKYSQQSNEWLRRKPSADLVANRVALNEKKILEIKTAFDHSCLCRLGCRNKGCSKFPFPIFFARESSFYTSFRKSYIHDQQTIEELATAAGGINLTIEHALSKHECNLLGIDPDFDGNHFVACLSCNSFLGHKTFAEKARSLLNVTQDKSLICDFLVSRVRKGLVQAGHDAIAGNIERQISKIVG